MPAVLISVILRCKPLYDYVICSSNLSTEPPGQLTQVKGTQAVRDFAVQERCSHSDNIPAVSVCYWFVCLFLDAPESKHA